VKKLLRNLLPWLICIAIFAYLFHSFGQDGSLHPDEIWRTLKLAQWPFLLLSGLIYFTVVLYADCIGIRHFISRFAAPVSFSETLLVRGVSFLMMIFNYGAGQGAFAVYLRKTRRAPLARSLGAMAFLSSADIMLIFTSGAVALLIEDVVFEGVSLRRMGLAAIGVIYLLYGAWILFWRNADGPWIGKLRRFRLVNWLIAHDVFHIFREAKFRDYLILFLCRTPVLAVVVCGYNLAVTSFNAHIDWVYILLYNPIILFAGSLPLTPAGLGTSQILMLRFYGDVTTGPLIASGAASAANILLTSSLAWILLNQLFKALYGAYCLSHTSRQLFETTAEN
jgi:uncharacterized membrane protein YbhN (UPF0104 family)